MEVLGLFGPFIGHRLLKACLASGIMVSPIELPPGFYVAKEIRF